MQGCHSGVGTASANSVAQSEPSVLRYFDCLGHTEVNVDVFLA